MNDMQINEATSVNGKSVRVKVPTELLPLQIYSCLDLLISMQIRKVFRIGTVHCNWPMSAHASQAFSIAHCTDSEDLPADPRVRVKALGLGLAIVSASTSAFYP